MIRDVLEKLQLPYFIMKDVNCFSKWIYGGFLRWIVSYIEENDSCPNMYSVEEYLIKSDMDIRIRPYKNQGCDAIIAIYNKVKEMGGYIEFVGNEYKNHYELNQYKDLKMCKTENEKSYIYYGNYFIWIPSQTQQGAFMRYDISYFNEAGCQYTKDFSVNMLEYGLIKGLTARQIDKVLTDIKARTISFVITDAKKIYRCKKLIDRGYTLTEKSVKELYEKIKTILKEWEWDDFHIYENISEPSIKNPTEGVIHITKHKPLIFNKKSFEQSYIVQYIIEKYDTCCL
jgi:hypothetical protein